MTELVNYEKHGEHIGVVKLNRTDAMNALSRELRQQLEQQIESCTHDDSLRALIITGSGKAFCAGNDLKELGDPTFGANVEEAGRTELPQKFAAFPKPIIAAVNGFAITAGFEMALACDFIVASEKAVFADTHARVGVLPGWGLAVRLPRLIGMARAKELAFTGNQVTAAQACEWGFVNRVVKHQELMPTALALAEDVAACVPEAVDQYKKLIHECANRNYLEALEYEAAAGIDFAKTARSETIATRYQGVIDRGRIADPGE